MSSARKGQEYRRQSWKGGAAADNDPRAARRVRRLLGTLFAASLLACFAWALYRMLLPDGQTFAVCVAIDDYDVVQAPPLAFAEETLGEFDLLKDRAGVRLLRPPEVQTAAALERLFQQGLPQDASPERDVVIVYLAAHGVSQSDEQGAARGWLLGSDYGSFREGGKLSIDEALAALRSCRARAKVLALDAGSLEHDPGLGMVVNEFPSLLKDKVEQLGDASVWVMLSNDVFEKSHAAYADRRGVFGFYVARGLAGEADADGNGVDLAELHDFVRDRVSRYVWRATDEQETQTPVLWQGGGDKAGLLARAGELRLTPPRPARPTQAPESASLRKALGGDRLRGLALAAAPEAEPAKQKEIKQNEEVKRNSVKDAVADPPPAATPSRKPAAATGPAPEPKPKRKPAKKAGDVGESLLEQWRSCDQWRDRGRTSWTPVDYAPRRWLWHVERLKGYESQWLLGAAPQLAAERIRKIGEQVDWEAARQEFDGSVARSRLEQHAALAAAIRLRNDLLLRLRYYAAWSVAADEAASEEVGGLIEPLAELLRTLNEPPAPQSEGPQAASVAEWLAELESLRDDLQRRAGRLDEAWQSAVARCLASKSRQNLVAIETLRGLPWLAAGDRQKLLDRLKSAPRLADADDFNAPPDNRPAVELRARRQAKQLASLQWRLWRLAAPPERDRDEKFHQQAERLGQISSPEPQVARQLGAALAEVYRESCRAAETSLDLASDSADRRVAAAGGRLADVRSDVAGLEFVDPPFPNLGITWKLSLVAIGRTGAEADAPLRTDADAAIGWRVNAAPPTTIQARWSLEYDAALLTVAGPTKGAIELKPNAAATTLSFAIRAKSERGGAAELILRVDAPGVSARGETRLPLPRWQPVELLAEQPIGLERATAEKDSRGLNRISLQPLPSGRTVFRLAWRNPSPRERKVEYQLFALSRAGLSARALRNWPLTIAGEWPTVLKPLLPSPVAVTLAGHEKKPLSLPPFPLPAAPAGAAAAPAKTEPAPAGPPKPPQISDGLLCVATDLSAEGPEAVRRFWIDLAPLHPRRYLVPTVRYHWQKQAVEVDVKPREAGRLPPEGSSVEWRTEGPAGVKLNPIAGKLAPRQPALLLSARMDASKVAKDEPLQVLLDVDGYPRAFRYDVWCDRPRGESPSKDSLDLRFVSPPTDEPTWLKNGVPFAAALRVDAPDYWFDDRDHVVEVGLRDDPRQTFVFGADRRFEVGLLPAESEGDLTVETSLADLQVEFDTEAYPDRDIDVVARLVGADRLEQRTASLDGTPPEIEIPSADPRAAEGQDLTLSLRVFDSRSGVAAVKAAVDADGTGAMKPPTSRAHLDAAKRDVYEVTLPTKALAPGRWTALVTATDRAGNESDVRAVAFEIVRPAAMPASAADKTKPNLLRGSVKYNGKAAREFDVAASGPKSAKATTNAEGMFEMQLPPGKYKFRFSGESQVRAVTFSKDLTMPPVSAGPLQFTFQGP